jgi:hypothetical protein
VLAAALTKASLANSSNATGLVIHIRENDLLKLDDGNDAFVQNRKVPAVRAQRKIRVYVIVRVRRD